MSTAHAPTIERDPSAHAMMPGSPVAALHEVAAQPEFDEAQSAAMGRQMLLGTGLSQEAVERLSTIQVTGGRPNCHGTFDVAAGHVPIVQAAIGLVVKAHEGAAPEELEAAILEDPILGSSFVREGGVLQHGQSPYRAEPEIPDASRKTENTGIEDPSLKKNRVETDRKEPSTKSISGQRFQ